MENINLLYTDLFCGAEGNALHQEAFNDYALEIN